MPLKLILIIEIAVLTLASTLDCPYPTQDAAVATSGKVSIVASPTRFSFLVYISEDGSGTTDSKIHGLGTLIASKWVATSYENLAALKLPNILLAMGSPKKGSKDRQTRKAVAVAKYKNIALLVKSDSDFKLVTDFVAYAGLFKSASTGTYEDCKKPVVLDVPKDTNGAYYELQQLLPYPATGPNYEDCKFVIFVGSQKQPAAADGAEGKVEEMACQGSRGSPLVCADADGSRVLAMNFYLPTDKCSEKKASFIVMHSPKLEGFYFDVEKNGTGLEDLPAGGGNKSEKSGAVDGSIYKIRTNRWVFVFAVLYLFIFLAA